MYSFRYYFVSNALGSGIPIPGGGCRALSLVACGRAREAARGSCRAVHLHTEQNAFVCHALLDPKPDSGQEVVVLEHHSAVDRDADARLVGRIGAACGGVTMTRRRTCAVALYATTVPWAQ